MCYLWRHPYLRLAHSFGSYRDATTRSPMKSKASPSHIPAPSLLAHVGSGSISSMVSSVATTCNRCRRRQTMLVLRILRQPRAMLLRVAQDMKWPPAIEKSRLHKGYNICPLGFVQNSVLSIIHCGGLYDKALPKLSSSSSSISVITRLSTLVRLCIVCTSSQGQATDIHGLLPDAMNCMTIFHSTVGNPHTEYLPRPTNAADFA